MKTITTTQLQTLSQVRTQLIESYNDKETVNFITIRDLDNLIEEVLKS